jgi:elongation factor Ts
MCTPQLRPISARSACSLRWNHLATKEALEGIGRQVAMHVAATSPLSLSVEDMDPAVVERERNVFSEQARESGKPENIIEKMVEGRIRKFFEESVLLNQAFVMNPDVTVAQAIKDAEGDVGAPITMTGFALFKLGEGIEKEEVRFRRRSGRCRSRANRTTFVTA